MEDNGLKEFVDKYIPKQATSDAQNLVEWKKCVAWQIILEGVQEKIVSSLHGKEIMYAMWKH